MLIINFIFIFPIFIVFFLSVLAELNRTPMDFIEGESELLLLFNYMFPLYIIVLYKSYLFYILISLKSSICKEIKEIKHKFTVLKI